MSAEFPEIKKAVAALLAICPRHTENGQAVVDPDCGDCGSRQEAAGLYLLSVIEDVEKGLNL